MAKAMKRRSAARSTKARPSMEDTIEVQAPWKGRHNYVLNSQTVLRDVYRLLCIVMADGAIAGLAENDQDPLVRLRG